MKNLFFLLLVAKKINSTSFHGGVDREQRGLGEWCCVCERMEEKIRFYLSTITFW